MAAESGIDEGLSEKLAVGIYDRGFVRFGNFTLKSGSWSPVYVNLRGIGSLDKQSELSIPQQVKIRNTVVDAYAALVDSFEDVDHIMGIPEAALTTAGLVGERAVRSVLQLRVKPKTHGQPVGIEGDYTALDRVVLLDDVVTTGGAKIEAAEQIRAIGPQPIGIAVLVDREQGGRQEVEADGMSLASALGMSTMALMLRDNRRITADQYSLIRDYLDGAIIEPPIS